MKFKRTLAMLSFLSLLTGVTQGQTYSVKWSAFSGGGGSIGKAPHKVTALLGDPLAGSSPGGGYTITSGFGNVLGIQPTAGAPELTIALGIGAVVVSWPLPADGWMLERTPTLTGRSAKWTAVSEPYQTDGTHRFITVTPGKESAYFRLRKP